MQIWEQATDIPPQLGATVATIGNFDGVHQGHRFVLGQVVSLAHELGEQAVAITFHPHPKAVLRPQDAPEQVTHVTDRLRLLAQAGLDAVWVMPFTHELAGWSPRRFVQDVLVDALHVTHVVVGHDIRFGKHNSGDISTMRELGEELGFEVLTVADLGDSGHQVSRWSSTQIRHLLADGDVTAAARVLGRPHWVTGEVVHGDHRGRELGYPTANLEPDSRGMVPADGVYAGWLIRDPHGESPQRLPAAISVGTNPTFDGQGRRVEAYALDRTDLDLYGEVVRFEFAEFLRPTIKFDSVEELLHQMKLDVEHTKTSLAVTVGTANSDQSE